MLPGFANNRDPNSLASRMRAKRNQHFRDMVASLPRPLKILDVGGTETVWETIGFAGQPDIDITLLNVSRTKTSHANIVNILGDARKMPEYADGTFDVVYSNSVIEHVGGLDDMYSMASEIRRVGKRYFLQTPNRYFPVEPHFIFPAFQFLPRSLRVYLLQHFDLGWVKKRPEKAAAQQAVDGVLLLSRGQLQAMFPDGKMEKEKFFVLTKSLIVYRM